MVAVSVRMSKPDTTPLRRQAQQLKRDLHRAALDVTDLVTEKAYRNIQAKMRSVGLGQLYRAVGWTSAKKKRQTGNTPYGVIYAKGGDDTLAGGALEAYSRGTTIRAKSGTWLAIPTAAAPRLVSVGGRRRRLTPKLWDAAGLTGRIGKLIFKQVRADLALLVVRRVSLSPKTGQAKALGKGSPRTRIVPQGDTVVFILIRETRRAQRFDHRAIIQTYVERIPDYMARTLEGYQRAAQ